MRFLRKLLSGFLWPLRVFGLGSDAYTLWSYREQIVTAVSALSGSVVAIIYALVQKYPPWVPLLFALGAFAVVLALVGWGVRLKHYLAERRTSSEPQADTAPSAVVAGALEDKRRRGANGLLGNALEEGEGLKQGGMGENQASYDKEVRAWVDRTYELIDDAYGKAEAQRFISNEGYSDEELFGRELPSFLHVSSTQRKYLIPARLKRLHELIDRMHDLDINPDFDPEKWS